MQYDLVFEGGGAKGAVFVGAIQEFERRGHTARRYLGTSAGAITATLMAAGYTSAEMLAVTEEKTADGKPRFSTFMDIAEEFLPADIEKSFTQEIFNRVNLPLVPAWGEHQIDESLVSQLMHMPVYRELFSFVERGGLYAGDAFLAWIREKLDASPHKLATATFTEFNQKTGSDPLAGGYRYGRPADARSQSSHRPAMPGSLGCPHVDEHSLRLAGGMLEPNLGHLSRENARRTCHCRRRSPLQFSAPATELK